MTVTISKDTFLTSEKQSGKDLLNGVLKTSNCDRSTGFPFAGSDVIHSQAIAPKYSRAAHPTDSKSENTGLMYEYLNGAHKGEDLKHESEHGANGEQIHASAHEHDAITGVDSESHLKVTSEKVVNSLRKIKMTVSQKISNQITSLIDASQGGIAAIQNIQASKLGSKYSKLATNALSKIKEKPGSITGARERGVSLSVEATEDSFMPSENRNMTANEKVQPAKEAHGAGACKEKKTPSSRYVYVTGVLHCLCFTFCDTAAKTLSQLLNGTVPSMQMNIGQFTFLIAVMTPYMIIKKKMIPVSRIGFLIAVLIGVLKCLNYFCCNLAVLYMPVGTATTEMSAVFLLTILAWTACCSRQFTRTSLIIDVCAVFLIISGVVLVVQPPFLFPNVSAPNVTLVTICSKSPSSRGHCYVSVDTDEGLTAPLGYEESESVIKQSTEDDRPVWKGHLFIIAFGISSTACLVLLSKGAKYLGNAEIIFWSALTADILSIISFAIYTKCDIYIPQKSLCLFIWVLHAVCGGATGIFGNTAVIRLPPADFGVISSLSIFNLFILQFTLLQNIKPGHLNAASVTGAIIICLTTFGKPVLRSFTQPAEKADGDDSETSKLLVEPSKEKEADVNQFCMWCA